MYNGDINFKGKSSKAYPLTITTPPAINPAELITEEYTIPGKDGTLYGVNPYTGSATITVQFALVAATTWTAGEASPYTKAYREVREWLSGTGTLKIGDAPDSYFEVQKVSITTSERVILRYGTIEATFTVYPFEFLTAGDTAITTGLDELENKGSRSMPLYKISGSGSGTLTVNGNAMTYTVDGELYIDTRRFIAYDENGANKNSLLAGDYDGLWLEPGDNEITATAGTLAVTPKWGYKL